jgi:hypothetical protein
MRAICLNQITIQTHYTEVHLHAGTARTADVLKFHKHRDVSLGFRPAIGWLTALNDEQPPTDCMVGKINRLRPVRRKEEVSVVSSKAAYATQGQKRPGYGCEDRAHTTDAQLSPSPAARL